MLKHINKIIFLFIAFLPLLANAQSDSAKASIEIPNIFTPNYDGVNDLFKVQLKKINNFNCTVFNRYGVKIYEWNSLNGAWDGTTTSGIQVPEGVYFFIIEAKGIDGSDYNEKGFVQVLR